MVSVTDKLMRHTTQSMPISKQYCRLLCVCVSALRRRNSRYQLDMPFRRRTFSIIVPQLQTGFDSLLQSRGGGRGKGVGAGNLPPAPERPEAGRRHLQNPCRTIFQICD